MTPIHAHSRMKSSDVAPARALTQNFNGPDNLRSSIGQWHTILDQVPESTSATVPARMPVTSQNVACRRR